MQRGNCANVIPRRSAAGTYAPQLQSQIESIPLRREGPDGDYGSMESSSRQKISGSMPHITIGPCGYQHRRRNFADWGHRRWVSSVAWLWVALWLVSSVFATATGANAAVVGTHNPHQIVQSCDAANTTASESCKYYLIHKRNRIAREIVDLDTLIALDINITHVLQSGDLVQKNFVISEPLPSLKMTAVNSDEIMRLELLKISILQEALINASDIVFAGAYINPAIVLFQGRFLLCHSRAWGMKGLKFPNDHIEFQWINHTDYPFYDPDPWLGVMTNTSGDLPCDDVTAPGCDTVNEQVLAVGHDMSGHLLNSYIQNNHNQIIGQDPRLLTLNETTVLVAYTNNHMDRLRMGMAVLSISPETKRLSMVTHINGLIPAPSEGLHLPQKNWTPFIFNNTVYFVDRFVPFTVTAVDPSEKPWDFPGPKGNWTATLTKYLFQHRIHIPWSHGHIRGGTNAILVDDIEGLEPCYVAIFHSSCVLPKNTMTTYFMGALAFSAKPPFTPLAVSPYPIVHDKFYTGKWSAVIARHIDYVPFPVGLSKTGSTLYLSLGHQDYQGYVCKLQVRHLLNSLRPL
jgi:hypothetical protein